MGVLDKKIIDLNEKVSFSISEMLTSYFPFTNLGADLRTNLQTIQTIFNTTASNKFVSNDIEILIEGSPRVARLNNIDTGAINYEINGVDYAIDDDETANIPDSTKCYTLCLTKLSTFIAIESDVLLQSVFEDYFVIGFVIPSITGSEIGSFFGSTIDGSRKKTITHSLGKIIFDVSLLKDDANIDKTNFSFVNIGTTSIELTCNFPYVALDTINYKLS